MKKSAFFISAVLLLTAFVVAAMLSRRGKPVILAINLQRLPHEIGDFYGTDDSYGPAVYRVLNADFNLYRHYRNAAGRQVDLYIGYYGTAKGGRTGHNPQACLPGAGWAILEQGKVDTSVSYDSEKAELDYIVARKNGIREVMIHWYQSAGTKILTSGLQQNIQRFKGMIFDNRNDGAYVQVSAFTGGADGVAKTTQMLDGFARKLLELLPAYWPVEGRGVRQNPSSSD